MTDQYKVFGNPIEHSKSPEIHRIFAEQTDQDLFYDKTCVPLETFNDSARQFFVDGGKGLNITVPFKLDAYAFANHLSKRARQAGAVNTLIAGDDGEVRGDNTDGIGMITDIVENHGWQIKDQEVLILGAGGAVRGILGPLLECQPRKVLIANRTVSKAQQLAQGFSKMGDVEGLAFDQIPHHPIGLVINGTSASIAGDVPPIPAAAIGSATACYDMMYGAEPTAFIEWAAQQGATALADGLGMLVEQAAESFRLWRGVKPQTQPVIESLRNALSA